MAKKHTGRRYITGLRADDEKDERLIRGVAMKYGDTVKTVSPFSGEIVTESFAAGSLEPLPDRNMTVQHNRELAVGPITYEQTDEALLVSCRADETTMGNDVLARIRSGSLRGLSIDFSALLSDIRADADGNLEITKAICNDVSVVDDPAYKQSRFDGQRSDDEPVESNGLLVTVTRALADSASALKAITGRSFIGQRGMGYNEKRTRVQAALREQFGSTDEEDYYDYPWIRDMDDTHVLYEDGGKLMRRSYEIGEDGVTFGEAEEVSMPSPSELPVVSGSREDNPPSEPAKPQQRADEPPSEPPSKPAKPQQRADDDYVIY